MGAISAKSIIDNKRYDLDHIASEQAYFEIKVNPVEKRSYNWLILEDRD
jgi:hypothetical protein